LKSEAANSPLGMTVRIPRSVSISWCNMSVSPYLTGIPA
jgi:hypothetical protein